MHSVKGTLKNINRKHIHTKALSAHTDQSVPFHIPLDLEQVIGNF